MNSYQGIWLRIKAPDEYIAPEFIEFKDEKIISYELLPETINKKLEKQRRKVQNNLAEVKHKFINKDRLRFYVPGKIHTSFNDSESILIDTIFENDYERITPTQTDLTSMQIEAMEFDAEWNNERIHIIFNVSIDSEIIQIINKRLNYEGEKIKLEKLDHTYFLAFYHNGDRNTLYPIKEISNEKIKFSGVSKFPYEIIGHRISKNN